MNFVFKTLNTIGDIKDKTVIVRIDTDVDIEQGKIVDDTRLTVSIPTIEYVLKNGGNAILIGHLGRPDEKYQKSNIKNQKLDQKFSLKPIAQWFAIKFDGNLREDKFGNFPGWSINENLCLLENIRLYEGEEENDPEFVKELSSLGQVFVNDAFAVSHRNHASIVGVTKFLPSFAGLHLAKEVTVLSKIIEDPKRPLVVLIGGAKIETKLPMVEKMHSIADYVLVGGEIADQDKVLIQVQHEKVTGKKSMVFVADLTEDRKTITTKSVENFMQVINAAATIVWNGPVGELGKDAKNEEATKQLAESIVATSAYKVVGGGDTLAYLRKLNLLDKFDFVSTGGGAMLEFLSGKMLPGIKPLTI